MSIFESLPRPTKTYHSTTYDRIAKHNGYDGKGKTVLITGGATGVGYSMSKAFAEAGVARIVIVSRSPGPQEKAKADLEAAYPSTQVLIYQACITDSARVTEILQDLGAVDILVLCAALHQRRARATEISTQEIQDLFNNNVVAAFNLVQAYLATTPQPAAGSKTIINVSSAAGQMRSPLRVGYGSSKAAVTQVMQHFAFEQADDDHVRIFSLHPGAFYTPGTAEHFSEHAMEWEDINLPAHFALWLAGPESGFLSGRYVWAHWDVDELIALKGRVAEDPTFLTIGLVL